MEPDVFQRHFGGSRTGTAATSHPLPNSNIRKEQGSCMDLGWDEGNETSVRCCMWNTMFMVVLLLLKANWEWVLGEELEKMSETAKRGAYYFSPAACFRRCRFCMFIMLLSLEAKNRGRLLGVLVTCLLYFGCYWNVRHVLTHKSVNSWRQKAFWAAIASRQRNHSEINLGLRWGQPLMPVSEGTEEELSVHMVPWEWSWIWKKKETACFWESKKPSEILSPRDCMESEGVNTPWRALGLSWTLLMRTRRGILGPC